MQKFSEINLDSIHALMDIFYDKIRADKSALGAIFLSKVGKSDEEWTQHKAKIASFWQGMLLGSGDYNGQPLKAHLDLPKFPRKLFSQWLTLFEESLNVVYDNEACVEIILSRAQMIAQRFQYMLYESGYQ